MLAKLGTWGTLLAAASVVTAAAVSAAAAAPADSTAALADSTAAPADSTAAAPADSTAGAPAAPPQYTLPMPAPMPNAPDSLEGRPINHVLIHPRNIFDPLPPGRMGPLFSLANRLHVRTREHTIREQLLLDRGDPWSNDRARETMRNLRSLDFLVPTKFDPHVAGDSVRVEVETRDIWSTNPEFNIESADGKRYGSIGFSERNFLGLGKGIAFAYRDIPSGKSRSFDYTDPSLQGTHIRLRYSASNGNTGALDQVSLEQPFYAEDTRYSYGVRISRTTNVVTIYENAADIANFNRRLASWELFVGLGTRVGRRIERVRFSFESWERRMGPTNEIVPGVPPEFTGDEESLRLHRFAVEGRLWQPNYIERTRVNGFGLVEDFDLGPSATITIGLAPRLLGSSQDEAYTAGRVGMGIVTPIGFGWVAASGSTRIQTLPIETVGQVEARFIQQSKVGQTLVLAARGIAGSETPKDFEPLVGGLNGLRAYPVTAVAGRQMWRLNAENRWTVGQHFWENLTVGSAVFVDAARAWGPGADGSEWFVASGVGVRIALPQWSLGQFLRIDVAWPIEPTRDGQRRPVLSFGSSQAF